MELIESGRLRKDFLTIFLMFPQVENQRPGVEGAGVARGGVDDAGGIYRIGLWRQSQGQIPPTLRSTTPSVFRL